MKPPTRRQRKLARSSLLRFARYLWDFKLTAAGKSVLAGLFIAAMLGSHTLECPTFRLFGVVAALFGVAFVASHAARRRIRVAGQFPPQATAGEPVGAEYVLSNGGRRTVYDVSVGLFGLPSGLRSTGEVVIPVLGAGHSVAAPVALRPEKRGIYRLPPITAYATFPLGLFRKRVGPGRRNRFGRLSAGSLTVFPKFYPITAVDVPAGRRYQPGGIALTSKVGESPEYIGNREYRPGDPTNRIDFRSWARLTRPVVREYQEEYYCRIALVLDTFVPGKIKPGPAGFPDLEAAVSLSASVADALARGEYIIDVFAAGPELYVFRAGRHTAHFDNILEILACVDACRTNPFEIVTPALADELATISTVICVFLDWDDCRLELARTALERGCDVKVLVVRDGATTLPAVAAEDGTYAPQVYAPTAIQNGTLDAL